MRKSFLTILALAIAIAFSPLPELQAAVLNPGSQPQSDSVIQSVKAKKSMKKHKKKRKGKRRGKRAKSKGPGKCGTYHYWSKKKRRCVDKRK
jgi:hypothetical protein